MLALVLVGVAIAPMPAGAATGLQIGSKRFTESYVLGEILRQAVARCGTGARHHRGLGNTAIVLAALEAGRIDVYPEYTGTIAREILKLDSVPPPAALDAALAPRGLAASVPLGFNNSYALAMRADDARARGIARLSDLRAHPNLRFGLSQEFLGRADGWPGLRESYGLPQATPRGLDHGIAYEAIAGGQVDVVDVYTTDAKLDRLDLVVLDDDRGFFPRYDAVLLHRADLAATRPCEWAALTDLRGRIDDAAMRRLNAAAEIDRQPFETVAASFLDAAGAPEHATSPAGFRDRLFAPDFARLALEHLGLVLASVAAGIIIGVPLGVLAARVPRAEPWILGATGIVQTIPALALLAFLIPLTGTIGAVPALIALALYALLPIVRNTHAGLTQVPGGLVQAASAMGLRAPAILRHVELPLAAPTIFAGIRTSAVINVGTATIAAFIGAGGFGERIVTGHALNDHPMLLAGAVPAAALALLIERASAWGEWRLTPASLRAGRGRYAAQLRKPIAMSSRQGR